MIKIQDPDPALLLVREHLRNLDTRVVKAERKSREEVLLYGEELLKLRKAVGNNDNAFSRELSGLGLQADKNVRSDAQKLAHAVAGGIITRDAALFLPIREIRALPSPTKRRVPRNEKPPKQPGLSDTSTSTDTAAGEADEFAVSDDGSQVRGQNGEDPADDAEKPADGDDDAEGVQERQGSSEGDASTGIVEPPDGGAEDADGGGEAGVVGGAANEPSTLTVCFPASAIAEILALAQSLLPERNLQTTDAYMEKARTDPGNASKYRRMADIVRLNDLLKVVLSG